MASSFDRLVVALNMLRLQLSTASTTWNQEKPGRLGAQIRQFFKPAVDLGCIEEDELCNSVSPKIEEIDNYQKFLRTFLDSIRRWSNAARVVENLDSLPTKIEAVVGEIAKELAVAVRKKFMSKRPLKMLDVLRSSQAKIQQLRSQFGDRPDYYLSGYSLQLRSPLQDHSLWDKFVKSVAYNLSCIAESVSAAFPSLSSQMNRFGGQLQKVNYLLSLVMASGFPGDPALDNFVTHVASVVVRTAYQSGYWLFMNMDPVMDETKFVVLLKLQLQIVPDNLEFLQLLLNFLKASISNEEPYLLFVFLKYLLNGERSDNLPLYGELMSMLTFVINKQEESSGYETFYAEIKSVFVEAAFLYEQLRSYEEPDPLLLFELLKKIYLLKVEIFLKKQLQGSTFSMGHQIEELDKVLQNLKRLSEKLPQEDKENKEQILAVVEEVHTEVPSLYLSFQAKKITKYQVRSSLLVLNIKIEIFKLEAFFSKLLNLSGRVMVIDQDQIQTILMGLKLSRAVIIKQQVEITQDIELIFTDIEAITRRIVSLSHVFLAPKVTKEIVNKMLLSFADLMDKMKLVKMKLKEVCPEFPYFSFPRTNELGFMDFLLENLGELLERDPISIAPVKHHIKEIQLHIEFLRSFLINSCMSDDENLESKILHKHVINVAHKVEYIIDLVEVETHWKHFFWFYDILEEVRDIKMLATKIHDNPCDGRVCSVSQMSSHMIGMSHFPENSEIVVSLSDEEEIIIDLLRGGSLRRDIVSIVGMPGIGKTTIAKKLYNDPNIAYHFHLRAWCSVSQVYEKRELLLDIIRDIHGVTDEIHQMTDEDLELKLYQQLRKNRYLIVMDDVWDIGALSDLEKSLPDDRIGSRILLISRHSKVALEAKPDCAPHYLRLLTAQESWSLLEMKIFHEEGGCPKELVDIGQEIARHCKGLPLAVVAIAGILERTKKKQDCWKKLAENLCSHIIGDPETQCKNILQLSYMHLPVHLKACFLYLGAFLEDKDIAVSKLVQLWIAEGFIQKIEPKSLEDAAEDNLMDLIHRSLVMISKRRCNGEIKACRIHDLLRELCLSKAKEDNFLQPITRYDEPYAVFDGLDYDTEFHRYHNLNPKVYESRRLCICLKRKLFVDSRPSGPFSCTLIFSAYNDTYSRRPYDVSFISLNFKLLRVLDVECINAGISFPNGIEFLVQLRYLAISGDMNHIPRSIVSLWRLQTLIVKGLSGEIVLPVNIWCLAKLRHLHINDHVYFDWRDDEIGNGFQLENLATFSIPSFAHDKDAEKIIRRLPNLRKLKCVFLKSWNSSKNCNEFPRLGILTKLESLKITYVGKALNSTGLNLPLNLRKLTLSKFRLRWNQIYAIGRLPNLEVLKLLSRAIDGEQWDMKEEEFRELKFLMLDTLNIAQWNASCNHLPKLQHLVLRNCKDLEEVPNDFGEIPTLEIIEVQGCRLSAEESVRQIKEETEGIKVIIS